MSRGAWLRVAGVHEAMPRPAFADLDAAFEAGRQAGEAAAHAALDAERRRLAALLQQAGALLTLDLPSLAPAVEACVLDLVEAVTAERIEATGAGIAARAGAALERLADAGAVTLRLHPDDLALIDDADVAALCVGDATLARGTLQASAGDAAIADAVGRRLALLRGEP